MPRHNSDIDLRDGARPRTGGSQAARRRGDVPARKVPGEDASAPTDIPLKGWLQIVKRSWKEAGDDQVPLIAAGVAFYAFLALFPTLIATVLLYGLVVKPSQINRQLDQLGSVLPGSAKTLLRQQLEGLTSSNSQALGFGLVVSLLGALWTASGGMGNLITAVNITYDEDNERNFLQKKGLALLLTLGAIVFVLLAIVLVAVFPAAIGSLGLPTPLVWLAQVLRWVLLAALMMAALSVLYRVAPDRDAPKFRWVTTGTIAATVLWVVASGLFSLYVSNFSSYGKTYGSLAGVVVLLLWLWITTYVVLLGAEINAEAEQQTARDTTKGEEQPIGTRGAVKADSVPQ